MFIYIPYILLLVSKNNIVCPRLGKFIYNLVKSEMWGSIRVFLFNRPGLGGAVVLIALLLFNYITNLLMLYLKEI